MKKKNAVIALCVILAVLVIALAIFLIVRERDGRGATSDAGDKGSSSQTGDSGDKKPSTGDNEFNIGDLLG